MFQLFLLPLLLISPNGDASALPATHLPVNEAALALQDEASAPASPWSGSLTAGFTLTKGNSDTFTASIAADAVRDAKRERLSFSLFGNYGEQTTEQGGADVTQKSVADYGGAAQYDYKATERLYYYGNFSFKADDIANLDLRYILGAGAGYTLRHDEKRNWMGEGGLSFISETLQVGTSAAETEGSLAVRLASNYDWKVSDTTRFVQKTELFPNLTESDDYLARFDQRLTLAIAGSWNASLQYILDYDGLPAAGSSKADHRLVLGIGWTFGA